jgi:hypothetical protein
MSALSIQECIDVAVTISEEQRVVEVVGGFLHALVNAIELKEAAPRVLRTFDKHHADLRQSWSDCSDALQVLAFSVFSRWSWGVRWGWSGTMI